MVEYWATHRQTARFARAEVVASTFQSDVDAPPEGRLARGTVIHSRLGIELFFPRVLPLYLTLSFISVRRLQRIPNTSDKMAHYSADAKQVCISYLNRRMAMQLSIDSMLTSFSGHRGADQSIHSTGTRAGDWTWHSLWQHLCRHARVEDWILFFSRSLF
jgi:hypothetical protein